MRVKISKGNYSFITKCFEGEDMNIIFDKQKLLEEFGYKIEPLSVEENTTFTKESEEANDFWENSTDEELDAQFERNKVELEKEKEGKTKEQLHKEFEDNQKEAEEYFEFVYNVERLLGGDPIIPYSLWEKLTEEERKQHINQLKK